MANSPSIPRAQLIYAASLLLGIEKSERVNALLRSSSKPELVDLLRARLDSFSRAVGTGWHPELRARDGGDGDGEDAVKLRTARTALATLRALQGVEQEERASRITDASASTPAPQDGKGKGNALDADAPLSQVHVFGMRDIKVIQLLAALVARWGLAALVETGILPPEMRDRPAPAPSDDVGVSQGSSSRISLLDEDGDRAKKAETLADMTREVVQHLLLTDPEHGAPQPKGEVRTVVVPMLLLPALASLLQLAKDGDTWADQSAGALLAITNPSTSMTALFTLLAPHKGAQSSSRAVIQRRVSSLLSRQLVRPGGVLGLLNVLLGRAESEPQIAQLEQIALLLTLPPAGTAPRDYLGQILPRIMAILRPPPSSRAPPPSYIRALCFCISRLIASSPEVVKELVLLQFALDADDIEGQLDLLAVLIANIDPSPTNYGFLLGSVVDKLLSIWLFLMETKGDPVLREAVENLLTIWGRTLSVEEVAMGVSGIVRSGDKYKWQRTASGGVAARSKSDNSNAALSLEEQELTKLRPDPAQVVTWLKQLDRSSVTAFLLVSWLDEIRTLQAEPDQETDFVTQKAIVLRLQLVLKIIEECGSEIVKEAKQTLVFVDHALESTQPRRNAQADKAGFLRSDRKGLALDDLKIVESDDAEEDGDTQAEAEFPELDGIGQGDELAVTGLTLLLSILEGNETLSFDNTPILHSIRDKLDHLAQSQTPTISRLARDANMVLSLRRASAQASSSASSSASGVEAGGELRKSRQLYQDALKLLQDPILPVRAQGLSMLRSLVASETALFKTDPALIPAILDIFVQALQDDDSFLYLNAVQGLSGMASSFGKDISQRLMRLYLGKDPDTVGEGESGKRELDNRLRIGEALSQLVQRSAQALPAYVDVIVPPLLHVFRTSTLPVALRSSALTILAACAEVAPLSLVSHRETLLDACLDLLSLESRSSRTTALKDETPDPLAAGSTHPSLRRGAILFISLMLRAAPGHFDARTVGRMKAVLGYLVATDEDPLVRHNAGEVLEDCEALS